MVNNSKLKPEHEELITQIKEIHKQDKGKKVYPYYNEEGEMHFSFDENIENKIDILKKIKYKDLESYSKALEDSKKDKTYVEECGDYLKLRVGFLTTVAKDSDEKRIWHEIMMSRYKLGEYEKYKSEDLENN